MITILKKSATKSGLTPGSLIHIGDEKVQEIKISRFSYTRDRFEEKVIDINEVGSLQLEGSSLHWISVEGVHDINIIEKIGNSFGIHHLVVEDILNNGQRPKIENYDKYVYIVVKMLLYDDESDEFIIEQESFILGENYVISFSERKTEIYDIIRERIRQGVGYVRKMSSDYLMYALLDVIVDYYFVVLEEMSEKIEFAEDNLVSQPSPDTLKVIHKFKRQMLYLHKAVWPLREVVGALERSEISLVRESTHIYMSDLYDHVIQIMDIAETLRDILSSMLDIYLSSISNRMNEIMKVLTIISTVFIPLTFIVGLYGMNFKTMPEYEWPFMYPLLWVIMVSIVAVMLVFFKRKKWW